MYVHEYVCMLVKAAGQPQVPNLETAPTVFETEPLTGLELLNSAYLTDQRDLGLLPLFYPSTGITRLMTLGFLMWILVTEFGSLACKCFCCLSHLSNLCDAILRVKIHFNS